MEVVSDFRNFFHLSAYEVGRSVSPEEGYFLLKALLGMSESRLYGKIGKVPPLTNESKLLMMVHNAVIATIPSKTSKKKYMIEVPVPGRKKSQKMNHKEAKKFFAHVKVAEAPPTKEDLKND